MSTSREKSTFPGSMRGKYSHEPAATLCHYKNTLEAGGWTTESAHWPAERSGSRQIVLKMVAACRPGTSKCQGKNGSTAAWRRKVRSYSSQPSPPCLSVSQIMSLQKANISRVLGSSVRTAMYAVKQYTHDESEGTSRTWGRRPEVWPPKSSS